jgi:voltage-gated potassium channel Kch
MIAWLGLLMLSMLVVYVVLLLLSGAAPDELSGQGPVELAWYGLMRTMDAGTLGGDSGSWVFLILNLGVTLGGIFILSTLIGILTSGLSSRLEELRKGRSLVLERDHTVILGWSPTVLTLVSELVEANQNRRGAAIVILAEKDKVEMEDTLRESLETTGTTRIVCRTGSPMDPASLNVANVNASRAVIVVAPDEEDPDISVLKTLLAIINAPGRRPQPFHVVAEIKQRANRDIAKMIGKNEVELVVADELISRIVVQTCRQSGLSVVHTDLLDFGGDEIYFGSAATLVGKTFRDALFAYPEASVIGLASPDSTRVLPPMDTVIREGDQVIAIAADDDRVVCAPSTVPVEAQILGAPSVHPARAERTLLLGWNSRAALIVKELDTYVTHGSLLSVVNEEDRNAELEPLRRSAERLQIEHMAADTTDRRVLENLDVPSFDRVILLCSDELDARRADARVLVTLLHLRDMEQKLGVDFKIVSEMRDLKDRALAEVTQADDFIVSDRLVSLMMSQVAENKQLAAVLSDLFDADGAEVYLKPSDRYVPLNREVNFATVVEAAARLGEAAIGFRLDEHARDANANYGVALNPAKSRRVRLGAADRVIVVATS